MNDATPKLVTLTYDDSRYAANLLEASPDSHLMRKLYKSPLLTATKQLTRHLRVRGIKLCILRAEASSLETTVPCGSRSKR